MTQSLLMRLCVFYPDLLCRLEHFYSQFPKEFKKQYENKFGSIESHIQKMKPL